MINPTLQGVVDRAIRTRLRALRVGMPARVVAYDADKQRVSVKPVIHEVALPDETASGTREVDPMPVITDVPVLFPQGGGYRITFPIEVGDYGWLQFADRSLDAWLAHGGDVDPLDDREHHLTDAAFYPGVRPFGSALESAPDDCMSIGADDGPVIEIDGDEIRVGGAGAEPLATKAELQDLKDAITNAVIVPTDGGASFQLTLLARLEAINLGYTWPRGTTVVKGK